ncbi:MAG TPA: acyltransferase [Candidatus Dormibacteraeota bacterium]|nr:acyltransferase [Candidatus Dormibacteraeota bacterium]
MEPQAPPVESPPAPTAPTDAAPPPAAAATSFGSLLRGFLRTFSPRKLAVIWAEEWIGTLLRPIPSVTGFVLRYGLYKLLFARLDGFCFIYGGARLFHTYGIRAGRNLHINSGAYLYGRGGLTIGNHVLIGQNAIVLSSTHHWSDPTRPIVFQGHRAEPVTIGDDVWIGANAVVLPGVTVATGTVIGAGAVVTRDTAPYAIVAGVPARQIGERPRGDVGEQP